MSEIKEFLDPPFRWDLTHRRRLGSLLEGERASRYAGFEQDILTCCSRVLAFAGNSELVFIGRSPESVFDQLSGLLYDSSWFERLILLHFSMRFCSEASIRQELPGAIPALRAYFESLSLDPRGLIHRPRPVALIDLVDSGDTFGRLIRFLANWSDEENCHWEAVRAKIRLIGLTMRTQTSPKTWRWQQQAKWIHLLGTSAVKNVSLPPELWLYIGNTQPKVSRSYTPEDWGELQASKPSYLSEQLKALRLAHFLFERGRKPELRQSFARMLVREPAMNEAWFRKLVLEIRQT